MENPMRILLVEDNPGDARLLRETLRDSGVPFELLHVDRIASAIDHLRAGGVDVALLDLSLPDGSGPATVAQAAAVAPSVPLVVLTGLDDEKVALQAVQEGAQDYLVKGLTDPGLLVRALRYAIERKRAEESARHLIWEQAARSEAEAAARRSRFLAEASRALSASLDYPTTLQTVARLAVQILADYCLVDIVDGAGELKRVAWAHSDPTKELILLEARDFAPPREAANHPINEALRTGEPALVELCPENLDRVTVSPEHRRLIGQLAPLRLMVMPLVARERTLGVITLALGADQRCGPEERLLAEELAIRAALAVDNARLYLQAQEAAQRRDEVLGIVSHDLRNPLNVVAMMVTTLLRDPDLPADRRIKRLEAIERSAERMNRLIQDLLDVVRIEGQGLSLDRKRIDVQALVREAAEAIEPLATARSLLLDVEVPGDCPSVEADRERLLQVFSNLLGNAIKFTPEGGSIVVRVLLDDRVRFQVSDTGPGIPPEELPHVFNRFWQARRANRDGAGLGLPIVKGIVEAHGGTIRAESRIGFGTMFEFALPVA